MTAGDSSKTSCYRIDYWWPTQGAAQDSKLGGQVGTWIGKNAKALDKRRATEVVKLIQEQFPWLGEIEAKHSRLQHARIH